MKNKKHIIPCLAGALIFTVAANICAADNEISIYINGNKLVSDQPAIISNSRTMLPFRAVSEALGCQVDWLPEEKTVLVTKADKKIILTINDNTAFISENNNITPYTLNTPAVIYNNRTMVPLRFVAETLEYTVDWEPDSKTVYINYPKAEQQTQEPVVEQLSDEDIAYSGFEALNAYREEHGVAPLEYDEDLCKAAQLHAEDMNENNYFDHKSKDGKTFSDRISKYTNNYSYLGENIAMSGKDGKSVVYSLFANSSGHNKNMLDKNYTHVGVGYHNGYWVQDFGG